MPTCQIRYCSNETDERCDGCHKYICEEHTTQFTPRTKYCPDCDAVYSSSDDDEVDKDA